MCENAHVMRYRVCYGDTDRMGRVYYANYLVFAERARTEYLRDAGYPYLAVEADGLAMPVRQCHVRYHAPAFYDDELELRSRAVARTHAAVTVETVVIRPPEDATLAVISVELACVDQERGRPQPLSERLLDALGRYAAPSWERKTPKNFKKLSRIPFILKETGR